MTKTKTVRPSNSYEESLLKAIDQLIKFMQKKRINLRRLNK